MTKVQKSISVYDASSRYKLINELILAARANGDYYGADMDTNAAERAVVVKVDRMVRNLLRKTRL